MAEFHRIVWEKDEVRPNIEQLPDKVHRQVHAVMVYQSNRAQSDMRQNAKWQDQTSNARNGLFAEAYEIGRGKGKHVHGIVLYHSVPYGIWLETRFSGRYAIIVPTIRSRGPEVMKMVNKLLAKVA